MSSLASSQLMSKPPAPRPEALGGDQERELVRELLKLKQALAEESDSWSERAQESKSRVIALVNTFFKARLTEAIAAQVPYRLLESNRGREPCSGGRKLLPSHNRPGRRQHREVDGSFGSPLGEAPFILLTKSACHPINTN